MIDNFVLAKLLDLTPSKNTYDLELQQKIRDIRYIPKNVNFENECLRLLNKINKNYSNSEIKSTSVSFKKQIVSDGEPPKNLLITLYILAKLIKDEEYKFEQNLDSEMAEIDFNISITSVEIQIEELLNEKMDFMNIFNSRKKILSNINTKNCVMIVQPAVQVEWLGSEKKNDEYDFSFDHTIRKLYKEISLLKEQLNEKHVVYEQNIIGLQNQIDNLHYTIDQITEDNKRLKEENINLGNEIVSVKSRLKILEEMNKITTDSEE